MSGYERFAVVVSHVGILLLLAAVTGMVLTIAGMTAYTILRGRATGRRGRVITDYVPVLPSDRLRPRGRIAAVRRSKILLEKQTEITDESLVDGSATLGERLMVIGIITFMTCFFLLFVGIGLCLLKDNPIGLFFPLIAGFWFFKSMLAMREGRRSAKARVAVRRSGIAVAGEGPEESEAWDDDSDDEPRDGATSRAATGLNGFLDRHLIAIVGAAFLLAGAAVTTAAVSLFTIDQRYAREGTVVEGIVLARSISTLHGARRTTTSYAVRYRFQTPDGAGHESQDAVGSQLWNSLREQGPVAVQYLVRDPSQSRIPGEDEWLAVLVLGGLGGIFVPVGGGLIAFAIVKRFRAARPVGAALHAGPTAGPARTRKRRQSRSRS